MCGWRPFLYDKPRFQFSLSIFALSVRMQPYYDYVYYAAWVSICRSLDAERSGSPTFHLTDAKHESHTGEESCWKSSRNFTAEASPELMPRLYPEPGCLAFLGAEIKVIQLRSKVVCTHRWGSFLHQHQPTCEAGKEAKRYGRREGDIQKGCSS